MAIYDERLETHPVWASLGAAREALEAARDKLADPEQIDIYARIEAILNFLDSRLGIVDAQLLYFNPLDNIDNNLQQLVQSLRQFEANPGNRDVLDQAENQASGILSYLGQLPTPTVGDVEKPTRGRREVPEVDERAGRPAHRRVQHFEE